MIAVSIIGVYIKVPFPNVALGINGYRVGLLGKAMNSLLPLGGRTPLSDFGRFPGTPNAFACRAKESAPILSRPSALSQ